MYCTVEVLEEDKSVSLHVCSGWGAGPHVRLAGATFPVAPAGTIVDKLTFGIPPGLNAATFFCRVNEPRRKGSGRTAYLDTTPLTSSCVLLSWLQDDGKVIAKPDEKMSAKELMMFNPFIRSDVDVIVINAERKISYSSGIPKVTDPGWTHKAVAMDHLLAYITKRITLEELEAFSVAEQKACDELAVLQAKHWILGRKLDLAECLARDNAQRVNAAHAALQCFCSWVALVLSNRLISMLVKLSAPNTFRAITLVLKDGHDGFEQAALIRGQGSPKD